MNIFGNRVFSYVIKFRRGPIGLGRAVNPLTGMPIRKEDLEKKIWRKRPPDGEDRD